MRGAAAFRRAFSADEAIGWLAGQLAASRDRGFPGLRIAVDMSWIAAGFARLGLASLPGVRLVTAHEHD